MAEHKAWPMQAYSPDGESVQCMRCQTKLHAKDVAMFIRTSPSDAFSAWCPQCTRQIVVWAAAGMGSEDVDPIVVVF